MITQIDSAPVTSNQNQKPSTQPDRKKVKHRKPYIAVQVGVVSFIDEGTEQVLDILQEKAHANTIWLNTFSGEEGACGRQLKGHPIPDHGVQKYDEGFLGGAFYDYDKKYFQDTCLNDFRSPDYNGINILNEVLPKAKKRGIDVFALDMNSATFNLSKLMKNYHRVTQVDLHGRPCPSACFNHEDYRQHLLGKVRDYLCTYPDLAGIAWAAEREGPFLNLINGVSPDRTIPCFCPFCEQKGRSRGISVERARRGYLELEKLFLAATREERPNDGYFVVFWRLLVKYPEILAWENLWTESYHEVRDAIYATAKSVAPEKPLGWHVWHEAALSPFYRAEEDYEVLRRQSDFVKPAMYNNCGGSRVVATLKRLVGTLFHDAQPEDLLPFYYKVMNFEGTSFDQLASSGLSAEYVYRETKRVITGLKNEIPVYPGIDVGVPMAGNAKKDSPERVRDAVKAAFTAGASGVILARKYSEMNLSDLAGAGIGLREAGVI